MPPHDPEPQKLNIPKGNGPGARTRSCPPEAEWFRVAAGLVTAKESARFSAHAARCDYCGALLRRASEDLADEVAPDEEQIIAHLPSAQPHWQARLAERLRQASQARGGRTESGLHPGNAWRRWVSSPFRLGLLAAAAAVVVISLVWWHRQAAEEPPNQLLAQAYSEQRTLEIRFPGARYAPLRQTRGSTGQSRLSRPAPLLRAEAELARRLADHPYDPAWLEASGRAELLEWDYEAAIKSFKRAQEAEPASPDLMRDLATAYFEKAEAADRPIDYGTAIELLGKVLARNPDDPVALFNRAVASEYMFLYQQAREDWQHYLRLDSNSGWASEARRRLADVEQKVKASKPRALLTDPGAFVRSMSDDSSASKLPAENASADQSEEYLDVAMTEWLPAAFAAPRRQARDDQAVNASQALALLARLLIDHHRDRWLADMLKSIPSPAFSSAVAALAQAVTRNGEGDPGNAGVAARRAGRLFQTAGSEPGQLRARLEEVYALHRSLYGDRCLQAADGFGSTLQERGYAWAEAQLTLEQSICRGMVGKLGAAKKEARQASALSEAAHYDTLHLRCLGIAASFETDTGNAVAGWSLDRAGLALYWAGNYPPIRAYQFYDDLATPAEESGEWHLASAVAQEAVAMISATADRSGEAMARCRSATAESMSGMTSQAEAEYQRVGRLFAQLPQTEATLSYEAYFDGLALADLEAQRGEFGPSLAHLEALRPVLSQVADCVVPIRYYRTLGVLHLKRGQYDEAERAFRAALSMSESGRKSLRDERERLEWDRETHDVYRGLVEIRLRRDHDPQGALDFWEWYRAAALRSPAHGSAKRQVRMQDLGIDFKALDAGPALPSIESVRSLLPSLGKETVLSYAQFPDGLAIWAFDNRGFEAKWVPVSSETLELRALDFSQQCSDPSSDIARLQANGAQLYRWLIWPVEDRLVPGRTLVVEPDGVVGSIPFQALVDSSGRYLGARWALVVSSSVYRVARPSEPEFSASQAALVVGAPAVSGGLAEEFAPLPDAEQEARIVAARFQKTTLLIGREATLEAVQPELAKAAVFHFAGHALAGGPRSGLLLAPPAGDPSAEADILDAARLRPGEVRQCKLAVLSTCSALSEETAFEVPQSLAEELLRAGVPHVVASRWNVDSTVTEALMDAFYAGLLDGRSVPLALQAAAASIRKHRETDHPYFWAAFSAFGRS